MLRRHKHQQAFENNKHTILRAINSHVSLQSFNNPQREAEGVGDQPSSATLANLPHSSVHVVPRHAICDWLFHSTQSHQQFSFSCATTGSSNDKWREKARPTEKRDPFRLRMVNRDSPLSREQSPRVTQEGGGMEESKKHIINYPIVSHSVAETFARHGRPAVSDLLELELARQSTRVSSML